MHRRAPLAIGFPSSMTTGSPSSRTRLRGRASACSLCGALDSLLFFSDVSMPSMPPLQTPTNTLGAPVEDLLRLLKGRHKADILIRLGKRGTCRFAELHRSIPGLSERVLARQLDQLERDTLVERRVYAEVPARVEYRLSSRGSTLCPILKQMWKWAVTNSHSGNSHRT